MVNLGSPMFGADPIFQTKKLTVYPAEKDTASIKQADLSQLAALVSAVKDVFQGSAALTDAGEFGKASEEAAGLKIELGGKQNYTPQQVNAEKLHSFRAVFTWVKEALAILLKKMVWLARTDETWLKEKFQQLSQTMANSKQTSGPDNNTP